MWAPPPCCRKRFEAEAFLGAIARYGGTRSFMVPAHFIRVLQLPEATREAIDVRSLARWSTAAPPAR